MSGYMICSGACIACGIVFSFNPNRVPSSSAITGEREPICRTCMDRINDARVAQGLAPFEILPGAYEAEPCS